VSIEVEKYHFLNRNYVNGIHFDSDIQDFIVYNRSVKIQRWYKSRYAVKVKAAWKLTTFFRVKLATASSK
jgi:hypothetical protein